MKQRINSFVEDHIIVDHLEKNRQKLRTLRQAAQAIAHEINEHRRALSAEFVEITEVQLRNKIVYWARTRCNPKVTGPELVDKGPAKCNLRLVTKNPTAASTQPKVGTSATSSGKRKWEGNAGMATDKQRRVIAASSSSDATGDPTDLDVTSSSITSMSPPAPFTGSTPFARIFPMDFPAARLNQNRADFHNSELKNDDIEGLILAAQRACGQQTNDHSSQHQNVARRMREIELAIRTQINQFFGKMESEVRFDGQGLTKSGKQICATLVSCPSGKECIAMDHCHNHSCVSIPDMLAAITGSAVFHWIFQDFSVVKDVAPSNSVDEVLGFLGPECDFLRMPLKAIQERVRLKELIHETTSRAGLKRKCEAYAKDLTDHIFNVCKFSEPETIDDFRKRIEIREGLTSELADVFLAAYELRIDLAISGDHDLDFIVFQHLSQVDDEMMEWAGAVRPTKVKICLLFGIVRKAAVKSVLSKAVII